MTDWHLFKVKVVYHMPGTYGGKDTYEKIYRIAAKDDIQARQKAIESVLHTWSRNIIGIYYCEIKHLREIELIAWPAEIEPLKVTP